MMKQALGISAFLAFSLTAVGAQANTLATVNGKVITDEDLNTLVSNLPLQQKEVLLKDPNTRQQLIENLVDQELMVQDATAKKLDSTKEYRDALTNFRRQAMVNILVKKELSPKVTEAAVKEYFNKNKMKYSGDQVHAQHILVTTEAEANQVLAEVNKPGADFQKIAETKSKDPSAKNNRGDLVYFGRDQLDPAFTNAAFSAKMGDVVGPIKSAFGYHVIKVIERKNGKTPEFVEVEQKVRTDVQRDMLENYVKNLKRKAKVKQ